MSLPTQVNFDVYKGDTFTWWFRLRDRLSSGAPGDYMDLTGATAKAQIRASEDAGTVLAEFTCTIGDQSNSATKGKVTLSLTSTQTTALTSSGVWDVQLTWPDDTVKTYFKGNANLVKEVTRA